MVCLEFGRKNPKEGIMSSIIMVVLLLGTLFVLLVWREFKLFQENQAGIKKILGRQLNEWQSSWDTKKGLVWTYRPVEESQKQRAA
jgi:hypothetical protein